jgi:hypothetical protein
VPALLALLAVCACLLGGAPDAHAQAAAGWRDYVQAPASRYPTPSRVVTIKGNVVNPEALVSGVGETTMTYVDGQEPPVIVLDYGKVMGGFPFFEISAVTEAPVLRSTYSEKLGGLAPDGDYAGKSRLTRVQEYPVTAPGRVRSSQIEGGQRYERLTLAAPGTVTLSKVGLVFSAFRGVPSALRGYFLSSDRLLNRIWYAGVYTVNLNQVVPGLRQLPDQYAGKPVLTDGAKRDRRIWSGDLLTAAPTVYYALDPAYVRGSLEIFGAHPGNRAARFAPGDGDLSKPGPMTGSCSPNTIGGNGCRFHSATYSMAFVLDLYDYYRYTGNLAFVRQQWPAVRRQMAWNARHIGPSGLYTVDEATGYNWNLEVFPGDLTYVNSVYHLALLNAAALAEAIGEKGAARYRRRAEAIKQAVNAKLWNAGLGVYDLSTTERGPVVQDANVLAVLSGVARPDRAAEAMDVLSRTLQSPFGALSVSEPFPENFRPVVSPYMGGLQLRAYFETGRSTAAVELIRRMWGWMLSNDPKGTTWEKIRIDGRLNVSSSAAHAWSTGATSALSQYVLGAEPVEPGWKTWKVMPHPVDVRWTEGRVPTRRGPLEVRWEQARDPASFELSVRAPEGTEGAVWVPLLGAERRKVTRDGDVIWDGRPKTPDPIKVRRSGDYLVVPAQTGAHRFAWSVPEPGDKSE